MCLLPGKNSLRSLHTTLFSPREAAGKLLHWGGSENVSEATVSRQERCSYSFFATTFLKTSLFILFLFFFLHAQRSIKLCKDRQIDLHVLKSGAGTSPHQLALAVILAPSHSHQWCLMAKWERSAWPEQIPHTKSLCSQKKYPHHHNLFCFFFFFIIKFRQHQFFSTVFSSGQSPATL